MRWYRGGDWNESKLPPRALTNFNTQQQGTGEAEPVTNGLMASRPGLPFWGHVAAELRHRANQTGLDINVQTGPAVIMETLQRLYGPASLTPGLRTVKTGGSEPGTLLKIWPLGTFFTPCLWNDRRCHRQLALQRAVGSVPPGIVGYHRYSASWHSRGRNRFGILNEQDAVWSISAARWGF